MRTSFVAFVAAFIFGLGLGISGMTQPSKVIGFLDVAGAWDVSLAFVMAGAIAVFSSAYWYSRRRARPIFGDTFHEPTRKSVDRRLIMGAMLFGFGWGLGGFCPGPALVSLVTGGQAVIVFVFCMILGMLVHDRITSLR